VWRVKGEAAAHGEGMGMGMGMGTVYGCRPTLKNATLAA